MLLLQLLCSPSPWGTHCPCSPCSGHADLCCSWTSQVTTCHSCLEGSSSHPCHFLYSFIPSCPRGSVTFGAVRPLSTWEHKCVHAGVCAWWGGRWNCTVPPVCQFNSCVQSGAHSGCFTHTSQPMTSASDLLPQATPMFLVCPSQPVPVGRRKGPRIGSLGAHCTSWTSYSYSGIPGG